MSYDLLIVFSSPFLTAPLEMVTLTTQHVYLMVYLIVTTNIDKICIVYRSYITIIKELSEKERG